MNTFDALLNLRLDIFWDAMLHLILPVLTLAYFELGVDPSRHAQFDARGDWPGLHQRRQG